MQIFLNDLAKESWYNDLPNNFKKLGSNDYFCFFYEYDFENTKIIIDRTVLLENINIFIYGQIQSADENIGYFRQPFDTKDTLFYYFLRSYIGDKAKDFILKYKKLDEEKLKNETPQNKFGDIEIKDRITFQEAISKYLLKGSQINPILTITDSLDSYLRKKTNKSLYGDTLKRFARLLKHSAEGKKGTYVDLFIVPSEKGEIRYMIVGENSEIYKNSESLMKAKDMLRLKYSVQKIYQDTGWYFNKYDSKFRKMIDDVGFKLSTDLTPVGESMIYYPNNCPISINEIYNKCVTNPSTDNWSYYVKKGYNGKLGDAFYHPTLFQHYPQLYNMSFYFALRLNGQDYDDNYSYRYNPSKKDIVLCGYSKSLESILLHEIQHAIQDIEGFATGGNRSLASMINQVGGGEIREFLVYSKKFTNTFCEKISDYSDEELEAFKQESISCMKKIKEEDIGYLINILNSNKDNIIKNCYSLCISIVVLYRYLQSGSDFISTLEFNKLLKIFGLDKDIKIVESLSETIFKSKEVQESLKKKGFRGQEINNIVYQTYANIFGELEARTVQNIAYLESDLREYFLPYTSETLDLKSFSVILDKDDLVERKIVAAIEKTNDSKYIFHLTPSITIEPLIHELGHLVYDLIKDLGMIHFVEKLYINQYIAEYPNADEFFSDYFSSYISRLKINESISNDLLKFEKILANPDIDYILDSMFNVKKNEQIEIYLDYLKKLSENE